MNSRKTLLVHWEKLFLHCGVDSPRLSAQVLLAHVLNIPRLEMLLQVGAGVQESSAKEMEALALRRMQGEPVAYLVGSKEFYGLAFHVSPAVLIPRPETELILDYLLETQDSHVRRTVLDVGTGSGALAVTTATLFPLFEIVAVDISFAALEIAKSNAQMHDTLARISFFQGNLLDALRVRSFDIILANLPYVPMTSRKELSPEVVNHEPEIALFAGQDGLDCYRRLALSLEGNVKTGTVLLCEIDHSQGDAMLNLFSLLAEEVRIVKDLAGFDRLVVVVF